MNQPVDLAIIGAGNRSQTIYWPLFASLTPWVRVVAVCDPVREHADALAAQFDVPAFSSLAELVRARPMEAALVVTPIESHHAISCYLSAHGVHNLVETSMASMLAQAREMVGTRARAPGRAAHRRKLLPLSLRPYREAGGPDRLHRSDQTADERP